MAALESALALTQIANNGGNMFNSLFGKYGGTFGHSPWYTTLKVGEAQNQVNQQMANWNMENVTKPVYNMENEEWNRRFNEQNQEWQRQYNLQNEYNSPSAQLARWIAAGGNPAAFIDQGAGSAAPAAQGMIGNPSVNEAASAMAQPANLSEIRNSITNEKAANMHALNEQAQAIRQSIDNITEGDFRAGQLEALGVSVNLGKAQKELTDAQKTQILADIYGWSVKGQEIISMTKLNLEQIKEVIARSELIGEQKRVAALQGDVISEELNWLPFEKYFGLAETRSKFILNMQQAGVNAAQARLIYEQMKSEVIRQKILGKESETATINNWLLQAAWGRDVEYTNKVYPKLLEFNGEKLRIDTSLYGPSAAAGLKSQNWGVYQQQIDATLGSLLKINSAANQTMNTIIDGWATFQSKGASKWRPFDIQIGSPGYNSSKQPRQQYDPMSLVYGF